MELNERIIQVRKQAGLTQEQLGEMLGVSRQAVSKWESGTANPDVIYIVKMCELFHLSADWLLLGKGLDTEPDTPSADESEEETTYSLYIYNSKPDSRKAARLIELLFQYSWAKPAFPWNGEPITSKNASKVLELSPLVLCEGLTLEQAKTAQSVFHGSSIYANIYRDCDIEQQADGRKTRKEGTEYHVTVPPARDPLSGGAIFGLVVLGVIVAVLILSFF